MTHEGSRHLKKMDRIMATTITCESESLSSKDREDLSNLYLKVENLLLQITLLLNYINISCHSLYK